MVVQLPHGKTCMITGRSPQDASHHLTQAVVKRPGTFQAWAVTCNHDPTDTAAPKACDAVFNGFRFE